MKLKQPKEYQKSLYFELLVSDTLNDYLKRIDEEANGEYTRDY